MSVLDRWSREPTSNASKTVSQRIAPLFGDGEMLLEARPLAVFCCLAFAYQ